MWVRENGWKGTVVWRRRIKRALSQEMRPHGKPEKAGKRLLPRDSRKNTALWTLGCWPTETLFRLLANRTVKEKYEFSLCQAPLSMGFSGKNTRVGCCFFPLPNKNNGDVKTVPRQPSVCNRKHLTVYKALIPSNIQWNQKSVLLLKLSIGPNLLFPNSKKFGGGPCLFFSCIFPS